MAWWIRANQPEGHYEPTNCQWADAKDQASNQRHVPWPKGGGEKMPTIEALNAMEKRLEEERGTMY